jgi:hypothetical protein
MSTIKADIIQSSSGGAATLTGLYPARAWVNWKNSGGNSLVDSGNVSSVADNSVGVFTTTFSNAFASATYVSAGSVNTNGGNNVPAIGFNTSSGGNTYTTTSIGHAAEDVDAGFSDYINNTVIYMS